MANSELNTPTSDNRFRNLTQLDAQMPKNYISATIREIEERTRGTSDGGYALLRQLVRFAESLGNVDKVIIRRELIDIIDREQYGIWSIAVEVAVQCPELKMERDLDQLLRGGRRTDMWERAILFTLVRLGYKPILRRATAHIHGRLKVGDDSVLPMLAAMCKVSIETCITISSEFLLGLIYPVRLSEMKGYVPAFIRHFLDVRDNIPALLVRRVAEQDMRRANEVAEMFCEYLSRHYVREEFGATRVQAISSEIDSVRAS